MSSRYTPGSAKVPNAERPRRRPQLRGERLEDRTVPTLFTVTTAAMNLDTDGQLSLWEAISAANLNMAYSDAPAGSVGVDTIQFAPSLTGQTIVMPASVPEGLGITEDLTINGPGAGLLTLSGDSVARIFRVNPALLLGVDVEIRWLTLAGGSQLLGGQFGGAILNYGNLSLVGTTVANNYAVSGGGIYNNGNLTLTNCTLSRNWVAEDGGGIYNRGNLTVINSAISGNVTDDDEDGLGGGIFSSGTATLSGSSITGNLAYGYGGGIYDDDDSVGLLTITDTTISGNTVVRYNGGGIYNRGTLNASDSTICGNTAADSGGGVYTLGSAVFTNTTISGNSAPSGGGIFVAGGSPEIRNSTIAGNVSSLGGGGIWQSAIGTTTLASSLVAGNVASSAGPDLRGVFTLGNSLVQRIGGFTFTESAPGTNLFGVDPLLAPLAYNGGPTLTHALLPGSPALDRGSNPSGLAEDQRGYGSERVIGTAADIGAFESRDSDVRLVPDPVDRSQNVLVVIGTRKADGICLRLDDGDVEAILNGKHYAFDPLVVHRVVAFGMEGNDKIKSTLALGTLLDGGRGRDTLIGGSGADILIGGIGNDTLLGYGGRDILIGGDGIDKLTGGADDDILIGGRTTYDTDHAALNKILAKWTSANSYDARTANLLSGTPGPALSDAQVTDDSKDVLLGDVGMELLIAGPGDQVKRIASESLVAVT